jgi:prephenate dehydrogenase
MSTPAAFAPRTIALYSVGLLGGSFGLSLKTSGYSGRVIGFSSAKSIQTALSLGCIDEGYGYDKISDVIETVDFLILCSPINAIIETIGKLGTMKLPAGLVISDVGSTKRAIVQSARQHLPAQVHFIGGHPMAGSEKSGPASADPYLFQNAIYVLVSALPEPSGRDKSIAAFVERYLGCRHMFLDSLTHDTIAATVSHVPHILAVALMNMAEKAETRIPGTLQLAAGGFRDMTRIASAPYAMWHDILATNKDLIAAQLDEYSALLNQAKEMLADGSLEMMFDSASEARNRIPVRNKGFISPLSEILVMAKDQPGVIASMSAVLAEQDVNIKDIEVLKVREGEGGTIRMAFQSRDSARMAITILNKAGFTARER